MLCDWTRGGWEERKYAKSITVKRVSPQRCVLLGIKTGNVKPLKGVLIRRRMSITLTVGVDHLFIIYL